MVKRRYAVRAYALLLFFLGASLCGPELLRAQSVPPGNQPAEVRGIVKEANGTPLPGVTVVVRGTTTGTTTDSKGVFTVKAAPGSVLEFSFIGYRSGELTVPARPGQLQVTLEEATEEIEEVVVVGYGVQSRVSVTGAVSSVDGEVLRQNPSANILGALNGRLPGLTTIQTTGQPGNEAYEIFLRGASTVNDQNPLILIDGVPSNNITSLDPNEVESISILKDASSTAVFGVRGANGVILVTTRRGSTGKSKLSISAEYGLQDFTRDFNILPSWEYATLKNTALGLEGKPAQYSDHAIEMYKSGEDPVKYPNNDWADMLFKDHSPIYRVNVNTSGGTERVKYFMNAGYLHQESVLNAKKEPGRGYDPQYKLDRYNFRTNLDINVSRWIKATYDLAGYMEQVNRPIGNPANDDHSLILRDIYGTSPVRYAFTPEGYGVPAGEIVDAAAYARLNRSGYLRSNNTKLITSLGLNVDLGFITEGLTTRAQVSFDGLSASIRRSIWNWNTYRGTLTSDDVLTFEPISNPIRQTPTLKKNTEFNYAVNAQWAINYSRQFGKHAVSGLLLAQRDYTESKVTSGDGLLPYNRIGFSGRATYAYDNRYLLEFNAGYNGSEQFHKDERFGFFPAGSVGWVISNEKFLKRNRVVTYLKARASYGKVGNDKLGNARFLYMENVSLDGKGFSESIGEGKVVNEILIGNPKLTWEIAYKQNYGIEATFFKDLKLTADLFFEKRENILIQRGTKPIIQGLPLASLPKGNIGIVDNWGYEIEMSYRRTVNKDLNFTVRGNFSYNRNKYRFADESPLGEAYAYQYRRTGYQIGQDFGYLIDWDSPGKGFFTSQEEIDKYYPYSGTPPLPGDFVYKDLNGDKVIDDKDKAPVRYGWIPRINWGASFVVNWKGFSLSALFQGVGQTSQKPPSAFGIVEAAGGTGGPYFEHHREAWTPERYAAGAKITHPRPTASGASSSWAENDYYIMNRAYVRWKNVELSYTLPGRLTQKWNIEKVRVYINGTNLAVWDKRPFQNFDPELKNPLYLPINRVVNLGVNVNF